MAHDPGSAAEAGPVGLVRREIVQRLTLPLLVIKLEIVRQSRQQFGQARIIPQIQVLVLDTPPQAFDEEVAQGPPVPIHANGDTVSLQLSREPVRGELVALVAVEHPRGAVGPECLVQAVPAEAAVQRV
jgi:hypothetical protein